MELKGFVKFSGFMLGLNAGSDVPLSVGMTPLVWLSAPSAPNAPNAPICGKVVGKHFSDAITTIVP